jgi:hypothetical protein
MSPSKRPARRVPRQDDDAPTTKPPPRNLNEDGDDDDDEEDDPPPPRRPAKSAAKGPETVLKGGFTAAQQTMDATSGFAQSLKLEEKMTVIKFLEDVPYVSYRRHWIERSTKEGKSLRAWTCLKSINKDCPLCEIGDKPQAVSCWNVAIVDESGDVTHKSWDVGPRLFNVVKGYANDPKIGPLTKNYFMVSKTGKKGTVQHNVAPVSKTALEEDWDYDVPEKAALDALELYGPDVVTIPKTKDLEELASELDDEYE